MRGREREIEREFGERKGESNHERGRRQRYKSLKRKKHTPQMKDKAKRESETGGIRETLERSG